ncbi:GNAT family protein [Zafaria sp. J156]|uniref:GNAT family N-acetyltransferase n=1 Tax=Zafaria sp. J156 TaxID=3116490 RepID=UPI002E783634|nr:GNAT family protein [Zafaria sp. J156]MEE1621072.1 GNAT family protein [Zafaria sp. J156]
MLDGGPVLLRPFTDEDIEAMGPVLADPEVLRLTGSVHDSAAAAAASPRIDEATAACYRGRAAQPDRLDLAVVDAEGGGCVGEIVLNEWEPANQSCNLRMLIGPGGRDRGLGTAALRTLLGYAFTETELFRIGLEVYAFNPRAQRVYEKAGFEVEGLRRAALVYDGQRIDAVCMGLLLPDWMAGGGAA